MFTDTLSRPQQFYVFDFIAIERQGRSIFFIIYILITFIIIQPKSCWRPDQNWPKLLLARWQHDVRYFLKAQCFIASKMSSKRIKKKFSQKKRNFVKKNIKRKFVHQKKHSQSGNRKQTFFVWPNEYCIFMLTQIQTGWLNYWTFLFCFDLKFFLYMYICIYIYIYIFIP